MLLDPCGTVWPMPRVCGSLPPLSERTWACCTPIAPAHLATSPRGVAGLHAAQRHQSEVVCRLTASGVDVSTAHSAQRSTAQRWDVLCCALCVGMLALRACAVWTGPSLGAARRFKFDDERVTTVSQADAFADSFGGDDDVAPPPLLPDTRTLAALPGPCACELWHGVALHGVARLQALPKDRQGRTPTKRFSNAYMLVYVREVEADTILAEVSNEEIPKNLREWMEREEARRPLPRTCAHTHVQAHAHARHARTK
jgi:hypothetical protein